VSVTGAEDAIKPGKWEWTVESPKMQKPPPGRQLPPYMHWGPEGMITRVCLPKTKLQRTHFHKRLPAIVNRNLGTGSCDMDVTSDATTATRSMSINCAWSSGASSRVEGVMHFHGDKLDGTTTGRLGFPNKPPTEYSSVLKGRYVGPCDSN
jgi:hypothetical protein